MLWLSGYGPFWSQNATDLISSVLSLLEQLGPSVSKLGPCVGLLCIWKILSGP